MLTYVAKDRSNYGHVHCSSASSRSYEESKNVSEDTDVPSVGRTLTGDNSVDRFAVLCSIAPRHRSRVASPIQGSYFGACTKQVVTQEIKRLIAIEWLCNSQSTPTPPYRTSPYLFGHMQIHICVQDLSWNWILSICKCLRQILIAAGARFIKRTYAWRPTQTFFFYYAAWFTVLNVLMLIISFVWNIFFGKHYFVIPIITVSSSIYSDFIFTYCGWYDLINQLHFITLSLSPCFSQFIRPINNS